MLRRLQIKDFIIVDRLELEFGPGFGALTGETGAGKSILVDALALALGDRADAVVVRAGRERADIGAEFDVAPGSAAAEWLATNDFVEETGACLVRRIIDAGGRSRGYINGAAATVTQLRELGAHLADLHGQHAHHALLHGDVQRDLLDEHAGLRELAREVAGLYREWSGLREACALAQADVEASARERDMLDWQLVELERLGFDPRAWEQTNEEHRRLSHGASLLAGVTEALQVLDEGDQAVITQVERMSRRLEELAAYDVRLEEPLGLAASAGNELAEVGRALRHYRDRLEIEPDRLAEVEARIAAVTELARKHRVAPMELPVVAARLKARRDELNLLADPRALAARERAAREGYLARARRLSEGRARAAEGLAAQVSAAMQELAMPGGRLEIVLEAVSEGAACGLETAEFRVAANPNQPPRPLAKVASGGELSRIGLAIQVVASNRGGTPTLVFDEVDVGIGGAVAEIVGRMLKDLGRERQVLCVTHLPQVAALADWQWSVAKEEAGGEVASRVRNLDGADRVEEIARMLGGVTITETTRRHASEMLGRHSR